MSVASPPWLDKKLLEVWLRPHYGETKVTECETQAADGKGDNYLSTMHRVVVRTKSGGSHSLIIKCRLEDGAYASAMAETRIYRKEQAMYDSTLARMSAILEKALPGKCVTGSLLLASNAFRYKIQWVSPLNDAILTAFVHVFTQLQ
jgi:hypothetical protein